MCIHERKMIIHWLLLKWRWDQLTTGLKRQRPFLASLGQRCGATLGSWQHVLLLLKLQCEHGSPGVLLRYRLWISRSGVGPRILDAQPIPGLCSCCWPKDHTLRSKRRRSCYGKSMWPQARSPGPSFFRVVSLSSLDAASGPMDNAVSTAAIQGPTRLRALPFFSLLNSLSGLCFGHKRVPGGLASFSATGTCQSRDPALSN